jgi:hypothetical protein
MPWQMQAVIATKRCHNSSKEEYFPHREALVIKNLTYNYIQINEQGGRFFSLQDGN